MGQSVDKVLRLKVHVNEFWALDHALKKVQLCKQESLVQLMIMNIFEQLSQGLLLCDEIEVIGINHQISYYWQYEARV